MKIEKTPKNETHGYSYNAGMNYLIVNNDGGRMQGEVDVNLPQIDNRFGRQIADVSSPSFRSNDPAHIRAHALALLSAAEALEDFQATQEVANVKG